ncbi:MAG: 2TM domain-containing protein [Microthrixaceae bacterium]
MTTTDSAARDEAIKRIHAKQAFQRLLAAYVVINIFLWVLWAVTDAKGGGVPWPLWVTLGWGVGMAFSAYGTFGQKPITDEQVEKEIARQGHVAADA